jgi:transcriptional regulator with XRE-family HTH domain
MPIVESTVARERALAYAHEGESTMVQRIQNLLFRSRLALHWTQRELGEKLGSSHRTAARWEAGQSTAYPDTVTKLTRLVHPVDRDLASELAASIGQTLVGLGLEALPAPPAPPPPPPAPPLPPPPLVRATALRDLIDCVVCSVADASDVPPKAVRPLVLLTLRRALDVGIDLQAASNASLLDGTLTVASPAPTVEEAVDVETAATDASAAKGRGKGKG